MSETPVPAGWYPDGSGGLRWWDGSRWTEHTRTEPPRFDPPRFEPPAAEQPSPGQPSPGQPSPGQPGPTTAYGSYDPSGQGQSPTRPSEVTAYEQVDHGYLDLGDVSHPASDATGSATGRAARARALWFVVGGVIALVVVLAIVLAFTLGGGRTSPEATVNRAFDAIQARDCDGFRSTLAGGELRDAFTCGQFARFAGLASGADLEITESSTDGDQATVEAATTGTFAGSTFSRTCTYGLTKASGDWLIDDLTCQ